MWQGGIALLSLYFVILTKIIVQRYEVRWGDSLCKRPLSGQVVVDGIHCGGRILKKRSNTVIKTGLRVSPTSIRPFEFSRLNLTGMLIFGRWIFLDTDDLIQIATQRS